ncbi:MAG: PQQ-binding-like beta-propeller repeat protein [Sedimentisphaerales bacterium]|nr:PQQ-binding-like beta-propeller repeat protein [Sedimentisphaerales bacterium]
MKKNIKKLTVLMLALTIALTISTALFNSAARAEDWPMRLHDIRRGGISDEQLKNPLAEEWNHQEMPPTPAWSESPAIDGQTQRDLMPRQNFDMCYDTAIAGNRIFFGSSNTGAVTCLDLKTGKTSWVFVTDGPVRLAPQVHNKKVYFGSDDGYVYCLQAKDGSLIWKERAGPSDRKLWGNGRMISVWPVRSSVLIDGEDVFWTAGLFPREGMFICKRNAADGTGGWTETAPRPHQGYLVASSTVLYVPGGKGYPVAYDRNTGKKLGNILNNSRDGGSWALLTPDERYFWTGPAEKNAAYQFDTANRSHLAMVPNANYLIVDNSYAYYVTDNKIVKINRSDQTEQWSQDHTYPFAIIKAGKTIFVGGDNEVAAFDNDGQKIWTAPVNGRAYGLAVAAGKLIVSTDNGTIHCFGSGKPMPNPTTKIVRNPFADNDLKQRFVNQAFEILNETDVRKGYCLILGCGSGQLAYELSQQANDLMIYCLESDEKIAQLARSNLSAAGVYGTNVCVDVGQYNSLPYSDYFANLVVVNPSAGLTNQTEDQQRQRWRQIRNASAEERQKLTQQLQQEYQQQFVTITQQAYRVLKPCGGVLHTRGIMSFGRGRSRDTDNQTRKLLIAAGVDENNDQIEENGSIVKVVRGELAGAGTWTHQYGDPGNTAASDDQLVKAPLGVLWYGEPGPNKFPSRHTKNVAPLSINGRVFVQGVELKKGTKHNGQRYEGTNVIICFDAYNGVQYWQREIDGAYRIGMIQQCSNLACTSDSLFVAVKDKCYSLDIQTGKTIATYTTSEKPDNSGGTWGYVAATDGILFGSVLDNNNSNSTELFARDIQSGKELWRCKGKQILNNTILIDNDMLLFTDSSINPEQRKEALKDKITQLKTEKNLTEEAALQELEKVPVFQVKALDKKSGTPTWSSVIDFTNSVGSNFSALCHNGVILFCGAHHDTHVWDQFLAGKYVADRMIALSSRDGSLQWNKATGHRTRPLIIGDTIYADPWAFDLQTGEQINRTHPVTGKSSPWEFERPGHACGVVTGCPNTLLFRSYWTAYYDLTQDYGTMHFSGLRTGCWINTIPAGGVVIQPEASSGCNCEYSLQCTLVMKPRQQNKAWGIFASRGIKTPVEHLAINLGAPGDRRDENGTLWAGFPRPKENWLLSKSRLGGRMSLDVQTSIETETATSYFSTPAEHCAVTNTDNPWLFASGCCGLSKATITLIGENEPVALYLVKLGFADTQNQQAGKRIFDIKIQGKIVVENFDIIAAAGSSNQAITKEFASIKVQDNLIIEMIPKTNNPQTNELPVLNSIEFIRQKEKLVHSQNP